jgi:hypothetical protein
MCFAWTPRCSWSPIKDDPEDFQVQDTASDFLYADGSSNNSLKDPAYKLFVNF